MHEIAKTTSRTLSHLILTAARLTEISNWRQLSIYRLLIVPSVIDGNHCFLRILLILEFHIHITHKMISKIITHVHLLDFAIFFLQFQKHVLEKRIVMLLSFNVVHNVGSSSSCWGDSIRPLCFVLRVLEHVLEEQSLTEGGFVVET